MSVSGHSMSWSEVSELSCIEWTFKTMVKCMEQTENWPEGIYLFQENNILNL